MISREQVEANTKFQELIRVLSEQEANPKLVGRGWTTHDIDILITKEKVKVPLDLLLLKFGRRWYQVSIVTYKGATVYKEFIGEIDGIYPYTVRCSEPCKKTGECIPDEDKCPKEK